MASPYPPLVTPEEIRRRLQRPVAFAGIELNRVTDVCEDASVLVRFASGSTWLDPDDPALIKAPEIVLLIARRCAERAVRNPEGFSSESAADYSYQRNGAVGEGGTFLTEREVKDLQQASGSGKSALWTQGTYRGDLCERTGVLIDDQYGCDPILYADDPCLW